MIIFLQTKILNKKFILSNSLTIIFFILISYLCFWGTYDYGADLDDKILRHLSSSLLSTNRIDIINFFEKITKEFNISDVQYDRFLFRFNSGSFYIIPSFISRFFYFVLGKSFSSLSYAFFLSSFIPFIISILYLFYCSYTFPQKYSYFIKNFFITSIIISPFSLKCINVLLFFLPDFLYRLIYNCGPGTFSPRGQASLLAPLIFISISQGFYFRQFLLIIFVTLLHAPSGLFFSLISSLFLLFKWFKRKKIVPKIILLNLFILTLCIIMFFGFRPIETNYLTLVKDVKIPLLRDYGGFALICLAGSSLYIFFEQKINRFDEGLSQVLKISVLLAFLISSMAYFGILMTTEQVPLGEYIIRFSGLLIPSIITYNLASFFYKRNMKKIFFSSRLYSIILSILIFYLILMNHNINLKKLKSNIPQNSQLTERIQLFSQYVERQFTLKKFKISDDIRNRYDIFDYKKLTSNKNVDINYLCKDSLDEFKIFLKADQVFEEQKNKINFEIKNC